MTDKEICGESMNEGDMHLIVCGLDKGHTTGHLAVIAWGENNHFSYSPKEFLSNADIGVRLTEETEILQNYLTKHGNEMPQSSQAVMLLRLISYQNIIIGDKPKDKS